MMTNVSKMMISILLILMIGLGGTNPVIAQSNSLDNSIYDFYENNENSGTINPTKDQVAGVDDDAPGESLDIGFSEIFRMLAALIFVILLLFFLLKYINSKSQSYKKNQLIQNLGGTSLGGNRSIQIVKIDHKLLIIGVGENVQLIKEISDQAEIQSYLEQYNQQLDQYIQPMTFVTKWLKKINEKDQVQQRTTFGELLSSRLEEVKKDRKKVLSKLEEKEKSLDE